MEENHEMLNFVKSLADADRLRVIGALTRNPARMTEISQALGMPPHDVAQHLDLLARSGIVREQDGAWSIDTARVEDLSRRQFAGRRESYMPAPDLREKARKVLAAYLNADGSIKQIPLQPAKLQIILDYILNAFTPGVIYTEKEVNMLIRRFHLDTAGLRRDLVDRNMLQRESDGSKYWRPE
jgi:hypothetical protein